MFRNPWTNREDSPVNYNQPAVDIILDSVRIATDNLCTKLRIGNIDIILDIIAASYIRAITTINEWNTDFPLYNHCWQCVHSCYPEILRKHNRSTAEHLDEETMSSIQSCPQYKNGSEKTERDEIEEDIEFARHMGITPMYSSYDDYKKCEQFDSIVQRMKSCKR